MIDVFVSRPTWVPAVYRDGLDGFLRRLHDLDMNPRTLGTTDYPTKAPLDEVIRLMDQCRGAVILGYPQIQVESGSVKGNPLEGAMALATEWNHIEAGLAYARNLPLLVIHDSPVQRGVFDRGAINSFIFKKDLKDSSWCLGEEISGALRIWRDDVLLYEPDAPGDESLPAALGEYVGEIVTVRSLGRRIDDPTPVEERYRSEGECRVDEVTPHFVRVELLSSGSRISFEIEAVSLSYDDKNHRPLLLVRAIR